MVSTRAHSLRAALTAPRAIRGRSGGLPAVRRAARGTDLPGRGARPGVPYLEPGRPEEHPEVGRRAASLSRLVGRPAGASGSAPGFAPRPHPASAARGHGSRAAHRRPQEALQLPAQGEARPLLRRGPYSGVDGPAGKARAVDTGKGHPSRGLPPGSRSPHRLLAGWDGRARGNWMARHRAGPLCPCWRHRAAPRCLGGSRRGPDLPAHEGWRAAADSGVFSGDGGSRTSPRARDQVRVASETSRRHQQFTERGCAGHPFPAHGARGDGNLTQVLNVRGRRYGHLYR